MMGLGGILLLSWGCHPPSVQLTPGERLYRANCGSCHRLIRPQEHDGQTWVAYVEKYGKTLQPLDKQLVIEYLCKEN